MPNYVTNILSVSGNEKKIEKMLEEIKNEEIGIGSIDFNKIIPMPESLNVECGSRTDDAMELYKKVFNECIDMAMNNIVELDDRAEIKQIYDKGMAELEEKKKEMIENSVELQLGEQCYKNIQNYGYPTWYEWSVNTWGSKWNSCGYSNKLYEEFDGKNIKFETANGNVSKVIKALSKKYTDLKFEYKWAVENIGCNTGMASYEKGMRKSFSIPEDGSKAAMELAAEIQEINLEDKGYIYNEKTCRYEYNDTEETMTIKYQ